MMVLRVKEIFKVWGNILNFEPYITQYPPLRTGYYPHENIFLWIFSGVLGEIFEP
jgi:hypothetical protein